ncbi:formimidoylglutamase [Flavobacterium silvaticum]|uniref:Formimidoylglutamase n=1 Tax=Flavobacterium silvaticum TaxID=1852020 RepID=A0A972G261_9FLAO|nr:formimidoylglutamase [Flavobacterium silvaticum]NMH29091.1 formimidoylglutamase [Flavobacterium silvaticum]
MEKLVLLRQADIAKLTRHRSGEVRFGEKMQLVPKGADCVDFISQSDAPYVLFGIPEDIGIRANFGRSGAASAWQTALESICNLQHNKFCKGNLILALGHLDVKAEMEEAAGLDLLHSQDRVKLGKIVQRIDREVSHLVFTIQKAGKIPVIIGGGQNNAYGNIKGSALAYGKPVNVVNFDSQSDFRIPEFRHNGNGFRYAFDEGFLKKYYIFGLHENYVSKQVLQTLRKIEDRIRFTTYDEIAVRQEKRFDEQMQFALAFICNDNFGLEIDLDAIPDVASSSMTLSGFSVLELRRFVSFFGRHPRASYLHICEGAPELDDVNKKHLIGKLIGYLVTDFIKSRQPAEE